MTAETSASQHGGTRGRRRRQWWPGSLTVARTAAGSAGVALSTGAIPEGWPQAIAVSVTAAGVVVEFLAGYQRRKR